MFAHEVNLSKMEPGLKNWPMAGDTAVGSGTGE